MNPGTQSTRSGTRTPTGQSPTSVWVDLTSPAIPSMFRSMLTGLDGIETSMTVRNKGETVSLATLAGFDFEVVGSDPDTFLKRVAGVPFRTAQLTARMPPCEVSLSFQNAMCILASKARGVPSIHFDDNDITAYIDTPLVRRLYTRFEADATYNVVPEAFHTEELTRRGADPDSIYTFDGYKEDISVATFAPDPTFTDGLPFEDYVVVRPEALTAAYVDEKRSLVPSLLKRLVSAGENVVYLPRGRSGDRAHGTPYPDDRVYTPPEPLDGLQLSWHARCVLTGSGTLAREAACMNTPSVSFFPMTCLSVDQRLIEEGRIFHSRTVADIVAYVTGLDASDVEPDVQHAQVVYEEFLTLVQGLIDEAVTN